MIRRARAPGAAAALLAAVLLVACSGRGERALTPGPTPGPRPIPDAPAPRPDLVANGAVRAIAVAPDGTAYLGGDFTAIGKYTGQVAVLDALTGALAPAAAGLGLTCERFDGISAAAADGHGGFYVGGQLATVPDVDGRSVAHVRADGTIDATFVASLDGGVGALAVGDGVVYVGGTFHHVGAATRHGLAALDPSTGAVTSWDPMGPFGAEFPMSIGALALGDKIIYAGGAWYDGSGWLRAMDPAGTMSAWRPAIGGGRVNALAVRGGTLYTGGSFLSVDGKPRTGLAAFDRSGALSSWSVEAEKVGALAVMDGTLYAGGSFKTVDGRPHRGIVALDPAGTPGTWDPGVDGRVSALAASGGTLIVGGLFEKIGGERRLNLAAFDTSGALLPWDPVANLEVRTLAAAGERVLAGGDFTSVGATRRSRLAALDPEGRLTAWDPDVDRTVAGASVNALAVAGDRVYAGGLFDAVRGSPRTNLAAVDLAGNVVSGTPPFDDAVRALAVLGGTVYAGGDFRTVGGVPRAALASFDPAAGGSVLAFDAALAGAGSTPPAVRALAARGSMLYVGGSFERAGTALRTNGAAFSAGGRLQPWNPSAPGRDLYLNGPISAGIHAIAPTDAGIFIGGQFDSLGNTARRDLARVDPTTGAADGWDPAAGSTLVTAFSILPAGDTVYVGGIFVQQYSGQARSARALDAVSGAVKGWSPGESYLVYALGRSGDRILLGDANGFTRVAP